MPSTRSVLALLLLVSAGRGEAQPVPNGGEFQVNSYTTNGQFWPAIAASDDGSLIAVWGSVGSFGTDSDRSSIQAQIFDAFGNPLGGQFQVNTYTTSSQILPSVAIDPTGASVVAWLSLEDPWGVGWVLRAQRLTPTGASLGDEFQVNTLPIGYNEYTGAGAIGISANATGGFVVAWDSFWSSGGSDSDGFSVQARRYDAEGNPLGDQFQVNTYTTSWQYRASVACDAAGGFIVAWSSIGSNGSDTSGLSIQARRYDNEGTPLGAEFQVNDYTTNSQRRPSVAAAPDGDFVISWDSIGSGDDDTYGYSIHAKGFDSLGLPRDAELQVNTYTTGNQRNSFIAIDASGSFVVTWESAGSSGPDASSSSVQARRYSSGRVPLEADFQVNSFTIGPQSRPSVATDPQGNLVVAWESLRSDGTDQDWSIRAQRYDALFRDGFESGDSTRWSPTLP